MSKKLLGFDLDELIKSSLSGLFEAVKEDESVENMKEKLKQQNQVQSKNSRKKAYDKSSEEKVADESPEIKASKPAKIKHEKVPEITAKSIKNKIDAIRSGKSLKDEETYSALSVYFEKLNGPERVALFAFLTGLEKILVKQSESAKPPHQSPYSIDMEQDAEIASSGDKPPSKKPQGTKEISSSKNTETPIVVGERADTRPIKSKLWR